MSDASWCCTWLCVVLCDSFCTGHFVMVPLNLKNLHCLQHYFFEFPFNLNFYLSTYSENSQISFIMQPVQKQLRFQICMWYGYPVLRTLWSFRVPTTVHASLLGLFVTTFLASMYTNSLFKSCLSWECLSSQYV